MKLIDKIFELLKDRDKKIVAQNFLSLLVLQGANYILPLLILPFLVRTLGAEKFGLVMFAQSLAIFLTVFVDFGFNISGTREISLARNNKTKTGEIFLAVMFIKVALIVIAFGLLYIIVNTYSRFSIDAEVYLYSFGVVIGQALFPVWFFQGIEKMKVVTFINILAKLIFTLLVFILIKEESDYYKVPIYNSLGFIVSGCIGFVMGFRYINFRIPKFSLIKQLFRDSSSLFVSNFATSLYTASNVFILGLFSGNIIAGVYSSMEKLILAVKNVYVPLYQALYPWVARQEDDKKSQIIKKLMPPVFLISTIITVVILFFASDILSIVYDDTLITSYGNVFKILSFISVFSGLNMLYNMLYFPAIKRYKVRMNILIFGGLFNVIMNLIFVQFFGIYSMAFVVTFTELILVIVGYYYFRKINKRF
ncbi:MULTISPECIES: oligosaccharide flippase family protein [unclassified Cellulophaga]|uniref:oligosaccharide flippase family protein n=1 Tax=unclassified Cellulophaga TaxID=2634405 RepID=UPI0026E24022|nr:MULTISPECIES: oligosaccharide flippase family protein [unclassified Cellulophaga]MDO6489761.1 oligosaccharide flippase family protein [Cellulophaga sp. 2_MG-2023]MDO6495045.1 oligosaccharide flippase family protein [Cellulophaga sp. 3_MG-2023]